VFDRKLWKLLVELQTQSLQTVTAQTRDEAFDSLGKQGGLMWKANSRIGALLPDLF
jgi:hypothetical protein